MPAALPRVACFVPALLLLLGGGAEAQDARGRARAVYWPERDAWERRSPDQVGMDGQAVAEAVRLAQAGEAREPRDLLQAHHQSFGREPHGEPVGEFRTRGDPAGMIVRHGYIVAEWGDPQRVDMTFSVTKSFLSTVVGLAYDRKLIPDLQAPVWRVFPGDELFRTEHNRKITWDHLLRQTSDWEGTLWGKPEWADRPTGEPSTWATRPRLEPGTAYEYNDVRVNLLALAALHVWREPLPRVLREHVMDPIGASNTWRWHGYDNSWIELDGLRAQSVSGGGHWGGGMFISARDQARLGLLTLRRGRWKDRQILSDEWIRRATTPTGPNPGYGFMNYFLNTDRKLLPSAPASSFVHLGSGTNMIYVDPENDLVVVARWIRRDAMDGIVSRVLSAMNR